MKDVTEAKDLELDSKIELSHQITDRGTATFYRMTFNFGLIVWYLIKVHRSGKNDEYWFKEREPVYQLFDALTQAIPTPAYTIGPEYREH